MQQEVHDELGVTEHNCLELLDLLPLSPLDLAFAAEMAVGAVVTSDSLQTGHQQSMTFGYRDGSVSRYPETEYPCCCGIHPACTKSMRRALDGQSSMA